MQLRSLANPVRGCGTLKEGGCYARGDMGPGGTLGAWSWTLGKHVIGGNNYTVTVPARQMRVINLPATLLHQRLVEEPMELPEDLAESIGRLPSMALIDHVGSASYNPFQFAQECKRIGPSRRIPLAIGKQIAGHTPIPIVFTHSDLPLVDEVAVEELMQWADVPEDAGYMPTPLHPDWGIYAGDYHGDRHWIIPVLQKLHEEKVTDKNISSKLPPFVAENTLFAEQIYGISWVTRVVYIAPEGANEDQLQELMNAGIEPVTLED